LRKRGRETFIALSVDPNCPLVKPLVVGSECRHDDDDDVQARESIREAGNGDSHQRADLESGTARDRKPIARQSRGQSSEKPRTIPEN